MSISARNLIPPLTAQHLEAISRVLVDTETGLTGSEIGYPRHAGREPCQHQVEAPLPRPHLVNGIN
jgi:hypothetical protein